MTEDGTEEGENEEEEEEGGESRGEESQIRRILGKSPMELLVMCAPLIHVSCLVWPGLYFVSMDIPMLLISIVPKESRNVVTICPCLAWDTLLSSVALAWGMYVVFAIVSFVLTLNDTADLVMKRLSIR